MKVWFIFVIHSKSESLCLQIYCWQSLIDVSGSMFIRRTLAIPFLYLILVIVILSSWKKKYLHWLFFFKEYLSLGPLGKKIDEWNQSWSLIAEHWASLIGSCCQWLPSCFPHYRENFFMYMFSYFGSNHQSSQL